MLLFVSDRSPHLEFTQSQSKIPWSFWPTLLGWSRVNFTFLHYKIYCPEDFTSTGFWTCSVWRSMTLNRTSPRTHPPSQWNGSVAKGTCCQAWQYEFDPQNPQDERRESIPVSCSLTSIPWVCVNGLVENKTRQLKSSFPGLFSAGRCWLSPVRAPLFAGDTTLGMPPGLSVVSPPPPPLFVLISFTAASPWRSRGVRLQFH